jgi:hypothetical protein
MHIRQRGFAMYIQKEWTRQNSNTRPCCSRPLIDGGRSLTDNLRVACCRGYIAVLYM